MERIKCRYSVEDKLRLLREYHESGMSKRRFCKTRGLSCPALLNSWLKRYESAKTCLPLQLEPSEEEVMANRSKEDYRAEIALQRKRIKELEKALEYSRLETRARDMMIDKAEEYFNIQIRKKSGAK